MKLTIDFSKFKDVGLSAKVIMAYLIEYYNDNIKAENWKYFNGHEYIHLPVEIMKGALDLSAFQQRNILCELEEHGYITTRLGQSRRRYFRINATKMPSEKLQLISAIKKLPEKQIHELLKSLS